jgi:hypothetical protein
MIDYKANHISYHNKRSLADFINNELQIYLDKLSVSPMPDSASLNLAYDAIIAALSHGTVIKQQDLRNTITDISTRLHNCEKEKTILNRMRR